MTEPSEESKERVRGRGFLAQDLAGKSEGRAWLPFAIAGLVVVAVVGVLLLVGHHGRGVGGQAGVLSAADPYAASLPITGVQMSDSSSYSGNKQTYLDGTVTNRGKQTVTGITVQVQFRDYAGANAGIVTMPVNLIRFRQPYVDAEPVSMDPIEPGQSKPFRLIFDAVPESWGGAYPTVRVVSVVTK